MSPLRPGDSIDGRYRLVRVVGAGATGVVWSARNEATERDFAIKLLLPQAAQDPQRLQRFFKEAKLAGRLRHRCVVEVYDLGRIQHGPHAGSPYLVMELLDGEPLDALLRRVGRLPVGTALRIVRDVARGLQVAHRQGVVHRDLKPANVFLHRTPDGVTVPKILDFGISKLVTRLASARDGEPNDTTAGRILGSPAYMSPEQTSGEDLDPRADLWSLGVVLYKALSGALPFPAAGFGQLMLAINTQDPKPLEELTPGLPAEVHAIVRRCLSRRRGDRPASAAALADAIDAALEAHDLPVVELSSIVASGDDVASGDAPPMVSARPTREAVAPPEPISRSRALVVFALVAAAAAPALVLRARSAAPVVPGAPAAARAITTSPAPSHAQTVAPTASTSSSPAAASASSSADAAPKPHPEPSTSSGAAAPHGRL